MPAANTYESIYSNTLASNANRIDFSSIPSTYTDLVLVILAKSNTANDIELRLNDDSGGNYSRTLMWFTTPSASISRGSNASFMRISNYAYADPIEPTLHIVNLFNYSNTSTLKSVMNVGMSKIGIDQQNHLWRSTTAINKISIYSGVAGSVPFLAGSTFSLYGIKAA
jgi:hypothetical protein